MREPLAGLEGTFVVFEAVVDTWNKHPGETDDYLLKNVLIHPWDCRSPVRLGSGTPLDHLWFRCPKSNRPEELERLTSVCGAAEVVLYQRTDGTTDFGINHVRHTSNIDVQIARMAESLGKLQGRARDRQTVIELRRLQDELDKAVRGEIFAFSAIYHLDDILEEIATDLRYWERSLQASEARERTAPKGPKPKGLRLTLPKCRQRAAVAFG